MNLHHYNRRGFTRGITPPHPPETVTSNFPRVQLFGWAVGFVTGICVTVLLMTELQQTPQFTSPELTQPAQCATL